MTDYSKLRMADRREIASDALSLSMGVHLKSPHPLAEDLANQRVTTGKIADVLGCQGRGGRASAAFSSSDFALSLDQSIQQLASDTALQQIEHRGFCSMLSLRDFKESDIPRSVGGELQQRAENAEAQRLGMAIVGESVALANYSALESITRHAILNSEWDLIASIVRELIAAGYRRERSEIIGLFETNPTLTDGIAWFDASRGNVVSGSMDASGLATATTALRSLTANGSALELSAAHLLVPASSEIAARVLVESAGLPVSVFSDTRLTAAYLLPATSTPVVSVAHLRGQTAPAVNSAKRQQSDDFLVKAQFDLVAVPISPNGIKLTLM